MTAIQFKQTDNLTDRIEKVTEIYYNDVFVGFKFVKTHILKEDRVWYRLICSLDTIEKCEKKFGYGWMLADCGFEIYPEDGQLTIEQIEEELLPEVVQFIIEQENGNEISD